MRKQQQQLDDARDEKCKFGLTSQEKELRSTDDEFAGMTSCFATVSSGSVSERSEVYI